jgi:hypothetical protein
LAASEVISEDSTLFFQPGRDEFFDQITPLPTTMVEELSLCVEVSSLRM